MAMIIAYPGRENANPDEWGVLIQDLEAFTGGLLIIGIGNINASGAPNIAAGSRLDINGAKYKCPAAEGISGSPAADEQNYIYAKVDATENTASFYYSSTKPVWDPAKGGWYSGSGSDRAVAKFFYTGGYFNGKVILDSYNAMAKVNTEQADLDATVGVEQLDRAQAGNFEQSLEPGIYRYSLKGGDGGKGGTGGKGDANDPMMRPDGKPGKDGKPAAAVTGTFVWSGGKIAGNVGRNGGNGGNGGAGGYDSYDVHEKTGKGGRGGDGGSGEDSFLGGIAARGGEAGCYLYGGDGEDGEEVRLNGSNLSPPGKGTAGSPPSGAGHAQVWRIG